jgi:PKD repeat protein
MRRIILLVALALTLGLLWSATAQAVWVKETVASTGDQGQYATIALDADNIPHIAWYDLSQARLDYAFRDWQGWHITLVDSGQVGEWASIAISPVTNLPAIAYYDAGNQAAKFAWYDGADWHTEFISEGSTLRGDYIHLKYRADGVPFVSYHYDNGAFAYMGVHVAWRTGPATWPGHDLDQAFWPLDMGTYTAIAFDSANYPQVAYRDQTIGYQKFGWENGSGWFFETAINLDLAGQWASIALDSGDNIYIANYNTATIGNDCACVIQKVGGVWSLDNIDCGAGEFGSYDSIAIDSTDHLHVTYYAAGDLKYAVDTENGWDIQTLDDAGDTGKFTGLALDAFDSPFIVYYSASQKDMMFMYDQPLPLVSSITPNSALNTGPLIGAVIAGNFFLLGSTAKLVSSATKLEIDATNVSVDSPQQITCDFDLTGAPIGLYDVVVTTSAGDGALSQGFTVTTNPPELTAIDPTGGANDQTTFPITLTGTSFTPALTATLLRADHLSRDATSVTVTSDTEAEAVFNIKDTDPGVWSVKITTEFGDSTLADSFTVTCGAPIAAFGGLPRKGPAPLLVKFTDTSATYTGCDISSFAWDFGDQQTSTDESPEHTYATPGLYTVSLTIISDGGTDTETKSNFIEVDEAADDDTTPPVDDDTTPPADDDTTPPADDDSAHDDDIIPPTDDDSGDDSSDNNNGGGCGC